MAVSITGHSHVEVGIDICSGGGCFGVLDFGVLARPVAGFANFPFYLALIIIEVFFLL